jgi:hypothetical protein
MYTSTHKCKTRYLIISLILFSFNLQASESLCNTEDFDKLIGAETIEFIDIATPKSKKWAKNYFNALKDPSLGILRKYKKKFRASVKVRFNNKLECIFPSKIRINGDWKDHLSGEPLIASLDVKLLSGNINSIIKFKLFIPHTRGGNNEVFSAALLKELGFLVPKTYHVPANFNGLKTTFIFQEKISKEFIESNNLREAPVLEGDERFYLANILIASDGFVLARVENKKWSEKGYTSLNISKTALARLNKTYLDKLNIKFIEKDREFRAIMFAMDAEHGVRLHNRKFYYDPMYERFKPIHYDGNSRIVNNKGHFGLKEVSFPREKLEKEEITGSSFALDSMSKLNREHFHSKLKKLGIDYSLKEVNRILDNIIKNLKIIKNTPIVNHRKKPYIPKFFRFSKAKNLKESENKKKLAFSTKRKSYVEICNLLVTSCRDKVFGIVDYAKLLSGKYSDNNGDEYIFIGDKQGYLTGVDAKRSQIKRPYNLKNGTKLIIYGHSKASINKEKKTIDLYQNNIDDRFLIVGGELKDWNIKFIGFTGGEKSTNEQRFNQNLLTGCLTLLDMSIDNVSIDVKSALCEDGVNLVRVNGNLNKVIVNGTLSDAIDVDFSELKFKYISVKNAGNDCVDLSSGDYHIERSELNNCKDKAISVGEKSKLTVNLSQISNSNIGLASKDSSVIKADSVYFDTTVTCFSAYNKKQEFWGGKVVVGKHNCQLDQIAQQKGSLVEFVQ